LRVAEFAKIVVDASGFVIRACFVIGCFVPAQERDHCAARAWPVARRANPRHLTHDAALLFVLPEPKGILSMRVCLTAVLCLLAALKGGAETCRYAGFDGSLEVVPAGTVACRYEAPHRFRSGVRGKALLLAAKAPETLVYSSREPLLEGDGMFELWLLPSGWRGSTPGSPFRIELQCGSKWRALMLKDEQRSNLLLRIETRAGVSNRFAPLYAWQDHRWAHAALCREGGDITFYWNGERAAEYAKPVAGPAEWGADAGLKLTISASRPLAIDELRISDKPPSAAAISSRYVTALLGRKQYCTPVIRVPRAAAPPPWEGGIDENLWRNAAVVSDFSWTLSNQGERRSTRQTWVHLMYAGDRVLALYKSRVPEGGLSGAPRARDVADGGDEVEFFVMPKYTETFDYFQFVGNAWESVFDSLGLRRRRWNGDWLYRCGASSDWWLAELRVNDLAPMAAPRPEPGHAWRVNFCRNWWKAGGGRHEWTLWSQTSGGYHTYNRFGKLVFGEDDDLAVRVRTIAGVDAENRKAFAALELANPSATPRAVTIQYDFYAARDYVPFSSTTREYAVGPGERKEVRIENDTGPHQRGLIEITVRDSRNGATYLYQMVKI